MPSKKGAISLLQQSRFHYKMLHQNKWDVIRSHLCHIISSKLEIPNFLLLVISLLSNYTNVVHMIFVCRMLHLPVLNDCHYLDNGWNARNIRRKGDTTTRILKVASAWQGLIIKFPLSSHYPGYVCCHHHHHFFLSIG